MEVFEIEHLLSAKLTNVLPRTGSDDGRVLGFVGRHVSTDGHIFVVNVQLSDEGGETASSYRCKIWSADEAYSVEGQPARTPEAAIDDVAWDDIDSWAPFQDGG